MPIRQLEEEMNYHLKAISVSLLVIVLHTVTPLLATDVTGKVRLQSNLSNTQEINRYPGRQSVETHYRPESASQVVPAVVYLIGGTPVERQPVSESKQMKQIDQQFVPRVLPILVGTTVDFPNMDPVFHNVFSYSKTKKFDLGRYSKGYSKSVMFDKPGIVKVFCEIHSSMLAHIIVLEQPYFTLTEKDGSFRVHDVPPGEYELHIWQENAPEQTSTILVPDQGVFVVEVQQ
jgi:plastocyanin